MKKLIIALITIFFSASIAAKGDVLGYINCGTFLSACNESDLNIDCQTQTFFASGVISTYSVESDTRMGSAFDSTDNIKYALIKYCRNNPLSDTWDGARDIFLQLSN